MTHKNTIITALLIGIFAGIAFILIQPLFGMATLTSRHANAYVNVGAYSVTMALIMSWLVHLAVSIFYTLLSVIIFNLNHSVSVSLAQVIILGWVTTLIATPANEWVVKLITTGQFPMIAELSGLNTQIGPKLWLHIVFFAWVIIGLYFIRSIQKRRHKIP